MHQSTTNFDENDIDPQGEGTYTIDDKGVVRKLLFKKRSTSSTCPVSMLLRDIFYFGQNCIFFYRACWKQKQKIYRNLIKVL